MAIEVPQNEEFFGGGKNGGRKGVGSAIRRRRAMRCAVTFHRLEVLYSWQLGEVRL